MEIPTASSARATTPAPTKVAKVLGKGLITIPREFRMAFGIGRGTLLSITLMRDHLRIAPYPEAGTGPVAPGQALPASSNRRLLRRFGEETFHQIVEDDVLDADLAARVQEQLRKSTV